jgi:hypothetical protein
MSKKKWACSLSNSGLAAPFLLLVIMGSSTVMIVTLFLDHNRKSNFCPSDKSWVLISLLSQVKTHVYAPLLLIICQESREQTWRQCGTRSNFLLRSPGKFHNWSQWCLWAHGLFGDGLHGWVHEFFQHSMLFCLCFVALNVHHLQLTLDRPWNMHAIQEPLSGLTRQRRSPFNS